MDGKMIPADKVIGTLDDIEDDLGVVAKVEKWHQIGWWKIGHELLSHLPAIEIINNLHLVGKRVFLDIKLWDTPRTVEAVVNAYGKHGVDALSIRDSVVTREVADIANSHGMQLWAIGEKTSASTMEIPVVDPSIPCSGIITSYPRWYINDKKVLIVPGIRLNNQARHDHTVTWHPESALEYGADYIVVGRSLQDEKWWKENLADVA